MYTFREKCIASDLARKALENKLSVDDHLNTEKYSQCKEESSRIVEMKNEVEGGMIFAFFLSTLIKSQIFVDETFFLTFELIVSISIILF